MSSTTHRHKDFIFKRDNYTCHYCGKKFPKSKLHIDHIIPKSKGGKDGVSNFTTACIKCNLLKGSLSVPEFLLKIKKRYIATKARLAYLKRILKNAD